MEKFKSFFSEKLNLYGQATKIVLHNLIGQYIESTINLDELTSKGVETIKLNSQAINKLLGNTPFQLWEASLSQVKIDINLIRGVVVTTIQEIDLTLYLNTLVNYMQYAEDKKKLAKMAKEAIKIVLDDKLAQERSIWENTIRKFHVEVKIEKAKVKFYAENPTRTSPSFDFHFYNVTFVKDIPDNDLISHHFSLAFERLEAFITKEAISQEKVPLFSMNDLFKNSEEKSQAFSCNFTIMNVAYADKDGDTIIKKKVAIRIKMLTLEAFLTPLSLIYLERALEKISYAMNFYLLFSLFSPGHDTHLRLNSIIHSLESIPKALAECDLLLDRKREAIKKEDLEKVFESRGSEEEDDLDDQILLDIDASMQGVIVGVAMEEVSFTGFSWISLKDYCTFEKLNPSRLKFGEILADHFVFIALGGKCSFCASDSDSGFASLDYVYITKSTLISEPLMNRLPSEMQNKVRAENYGLSPHANHEIKANIQKDTLRSDDDNEMHENSNEDLFYSVVCNSDTFPSKAYGDFTDDQNCIVSIQKNIQRGTPAIKAKVSIDKSKCLLGRIEVDQEVKLHIDKNALNILSQFQSWIGLIESLERKLVSEKNQCSTEGFLKQEAALLYQGLTDAQIKIACTEPFISALDKQPKRLLLKKIFEESVPFTSFSLQLQVSSIFMDIKSDHKDTNSIESKLSLVTLQLSSKSVAFHVGSMSVDIFESSSPALRRDLYRLIEYKSQPSDCAFVTLDGHSVVLLDRIKLFFSERRLTSLYPFIFEYTDLLTALIADYFKVGERLKVLKKKFKDAYNHHENEELPCELLQKVLFKSPEFDFMKFAIAVRSIDIALEDDHGKLSLQLNPPVHQDDTASSDTKVWEQLKASRFQPIKILSQNRVFNKDEAIVVRITLENAFVSRLSQDQLIAHISSISVFDGSTLRSFQNNPLGFFTRLFSITNNLFVEKGHIVPEMIQTTLASALSSTSQGREISSSLIPNMLASIETWRTSLQAERGWFTCNIMRLSEVNPELEVKISPFVIKLNASCSDASLVAGIFQQLLALYDHPSTQLLQHKFFSSTSAKSIVDTVAITLSMRHIYLDIIEEDEWRMITKVSDIKAKGLIRVRDLSGEGNADIGKTESFCTKSQEGISNVTNMHTLDEIGFWSVAQLQLTRFAFKWTKLRCSISINLIDRDEINAMSPQILLCSSTLWIFLQILEYGERLAKAFLEVLKKRMNKIKGSPRHFTFSNRLKNLPAYSLAENARKNQPKLLKEDSFEVIGRHNSEMNRILSNLEANNLERCKELIEDEPGHMDYEKVGLDFSFYLSKLVIGINYRRAVRCVEAVLLDTTVSVSQDISGSVEAGKIETTYCLFARCKTFNVLDLQNNSIFKYVVEMRDLPLLMAARWTLVEEVDEDGCLSEATMVKKRRGSFNPDCSELAISTRKKSHDEPTYSSPIYKEVVQESYENVKFIIEIKPIQVFLSDSTTTLLIGVLKDLKVDMGIELSQHRNLVASDFEEEPRYQTAPVSLVYFHIAELHLAIMTSSKTLISPVRFMPHLSLTIPMYLREDVASTTLPTLVSTLREHLLAALSPKRLVKDGIKGISAIVQVLKMARAVRDIARGVRRREFTDFRALVEVYEFFLWNLLKTGELGASLVSDVLSLLGADYIKNSSIFDKLERKLFQLESGDVDSLKH